MPVPFALNQWVSNGVIATQGPILAPVFSKKPKNFLSRGQDQALGGLHQNAGRKKCEKSAFFVDKDPLK